MNSLVASWRFKRHVRSLRAPVIISVISVFWVIFNILKLYSEANHLHSKEEPLCEGSALREESKSEEDQRFTFSSEKYQICVIVRYTLKHERSVLPMVSSLYTASGKNKRMKVIMQRTDKDENDIFRAKTLVEDIVTGNPSLRASNEFVLSVSNITLTGKKYSQYRRSLNLEDSINDWGYVLTDLALDDVIEAGDCEYIMVTNSDNLYHPHLLRSTSEARYKGISMIGTYMVTRYAQRGAHDPKIRAGRNSLLKPRFVSGYVDLGAIMWNAKVFQLHKFRFLHAGYTQGEIFAADGLLAEAVKRQPEATSCVIPEVLFLHL